MRFSPAPSWQHRALLPFLALAVLLVGCATNPLTGKRQLMLVSERAEIEMGLQAVKAFRNDYGVVEDPALRAFVAGLGNRLIQHTPVPGASYEYEPDEAEILDDLLPRNVAVQIYRALLENAASEQGSRMSAMDSATRNAGEMIDKLTLIYNRQR